MINSLCHFELVTSNKDKCKDFYGDVFGWEFDEKRMPGYTLIQTGQEPGGGILPAEGREVPAGLNAYFGVDDIDACLRKVAAHGGEVLVPKTPIPNVGHFAIFSDPEGITIGIMQPS